MTDDLEFTHISVASDDEDEIVIQAGAVNTAAPAHTPASQDEPDETTDGAEANVKQVANAQPATPPASSDVSRLAPRAELLEEAGLSEDDISEEARKEYEEHMRKRAARQQAVQMETTEEDLHTQMPFVRMQRTIMIIFFLLIVAAVVYWFIRHPIGA